MKVCKKKKKNFIEVELICSIVLVSGVYQNKSVIHTHIFVLFAQSLSHVQLFATLWNAEHQASLSFTVSQSLLKLMSIESVMPSNHLILCHPLLLLPSSFPASGSSPMSQFLTSGDQSIGVLASTSVLPMNIHD